MFTKAMSRLRLPIALAVLASFLLVPAADAAPVWSPAGTWGTVLSGANGIDVDHSTGDVYAVSSFDNAVKKFSATGTELLSFGSFGTGTGQFNLPSALAVGPDGDVYVTDIGNKRVQRFTPTGGYVRSYGSAATLSNPRGVDVDENGNVYVADVGTGRLYQFSAGGALLQTYSTATASSPFAVAVDQDGALWVGDFAGASHTVKKVDPATGAVLLSIGGFGQPTDVEVDRHGQVHVVNFNTSEIRTYTPAGAHVETLGPLDSPMPLAIAIGQYGRLYVSGGSEVRVFHAAPEVVTQYTGVDGVQTVDPAYAAATADHAIELIDFDGDGFDGLAPHTFTPIPSNHYAAQGVTLLGLDARSVGSQPWSHSPPIGAWQTGFSGPAGTYSFVFDEPVASFGMFANDVEAPVIVTVHFDDGGELFTMPTAASINNSRFYGFATAENVITRIDFKSTDYHIIDDVRFGRVPGVTQHTGTSGDAAVEATFADASAGHLSQLVDFDGDGFDGLAAHAFTPIPSGTYAAQGVTLLGLDARSVGSQPWAHSPPIGAWQTGFGGPAGPYSFVFGAPVASFGLFANDVEAPVTATVTLADGSVEEFVLPASGGASTTRFHGFTADTDRIARIDLSSTDYHIIDDVRFGWIDEPADGDGIPFSLDPAPLAASTVFDDGAGTRGEILANTADSITLTDLPDGVRITVSGGAGQATVRVCGGFTLQIPAGSELTLACGSVIIEVLAGGPVTVEPEGDGEAVVSVPEGVKAKVGDPVAGDFEVTHLGGTGVVTVVVQGLSSTVADGDPPSTFDANVAPTITAVHAPTAPVAAEAQPVVIAVDFVDPGLTDTHVCTVDWGDGTTADGPAAAGQCTSQHAYAGPGTYTVTVTVTDSDGDSDAETATVVVYDAPASSAECKGSGWTRLTDHDGRPFRNQGACVSYVERRPKA